MRSDDAADDLSATSGPRSLSGLSTGEGEAGKEKERSPQVPSTSIVGDDTAEDDIYS